MSKRKAESTNSEGESSHESDSSDSSSLSGGDKSLVKSDQGILSNGKGSSKKTMKDSAGFQSGQQDQNPMHSTTTQPQRPLLITMYDDDSEVAYTPPQRRTRASRSSSAGHHSQPELRRSNRVSLKVLNQDKRYFEGCLVMVRTDGFPYWPGMIRKAGADDHDYDDYICNSEGKTFYFVQIFTKPTAWKWRTIKDLKVFDASKPNRCKDWNLVEKFSAGIKIAKAALNFPAEERLVKFTLRNGKPIDNLLKEIDEWNSQRLVLKVKDEADPTALESGQSCHDSVDVIKKRMSEFKQELREECNREKAEAIEALTAENSRLGKENEGLKASVRDLTRQLDPKNMISSLEAKLKQKEGEMEELRGELEKEQQEKLKYKAEVEKMKTAFDEMFGTPTKKTGNSVGRRCTKEGWNHHPRITTPRTKAHNLLNSVEGRRTIIAFGLLSTGNESRKRARNDIAEQREQSPRASTSSQFRAGDGIIVKEEIKENDVAVVADSPEGMDVAYTADLQRSLSSPPVKKISVPKPHEKYFEGCLVMGRIIIVGSTQFWPGIIRKPGADDKHRDYSRKRDGKISLFVQLFTDPTTFDWFATWALRVLDVGLATAAANFSVEARLAKFSLPNEAEIDNLLDEIGLNINHAANEREKYFEGCLVMGFTGCKGYPLWPGMIRKSEDDEHPDYFKYDGAGPGTMFNSLKSRPPDLAVFDADKPNQCYHRNPAVVVKFEKAVKIAKAAANFSVKARLEKFTLLRGAAIDGLLAEIGDVNSNDITTAEPRTGQDGTPAETAIQQQYNSGKWWTHTDFVAQNGSTHPTNGNGESCPDSFEVMRKRMSEVSEAAGGVESGEGRRNQSLTTDKKPSSQTVKKQAGKEKP
ncbi:hypothetical protein Ocin01_04602 [Orchesella cincta]|uniref:PWWP domain-containing protein n=1 Tax=Orchesella cincta TaxID=48709 RepID=A0A1D2NA12_ORCCI|nr:hypothetical protein Ocin01_04602 [Orchesella cincta]